LVAWLQEQGLRAGHCSWQRLCAAAQCVCVGGSPCGCVLYYLAACAQQGIILCAAACLVPTAQADCLSCRVDATSCCTPQNHYSSCSPPWATARYGSDRFNHRVHVRQATGNGPFLSALLILEGLQCNLKTQPNAKRWLPLSLPKPVAGWVQSATWAVPGSSWRNLDSEMLTEAGEVLSCCVPCTSAVLTAAGA
jgi:hypothetical protein